MMTKPIIYHGTPMTPRAALMQMEGRAFCVSFYRPDDVEVVQAISPAIMFRQWRVFVLAASFAERAGMGSGSGLDAILQMARTSPCKRSLGSHSRHARRTEPDQRWTFERLAIWPNRFTALAHGRPFRTAFAIVRKIRTCLLGLDRTGQRFQGRRGSMVSANGRGCQGNGQRLAHTSHDARRNGCAGISIPKRGQHKLGAERAFI